MNSVNFINPVPPKKQKALLIWFYASAIMLIALIMCIGYTHIGQLRGLRRIKANTKSINQQLTDFDKIAQNKQMLRIKKKNVEEQLKQIKKATQSFVPYDIIQSLASITPPSICLATIRGVAGEHLVIEGLTKRIHAVTGFAEKVNTLSHIRRAQILSVTPYKQEDPESKTLQFTIEAQLVMAS